MGLRLGWIGIRIFAVALVLLPALPAQAQDRAAREQQLRQRVEEIYR